MEAVARTAIMVGGMESARLKIERVTTDAVNGTHLYLPKDFFVRRALIAPSKPVRFRACSGDPRSEQVILPENPLKLDLEPGIIAKASPVYMGTIWAVIGVVPVMVLWEN